MDLMELYTKGYGMARYSTKANSNTPGEDKYNLVARSRDNCVEVPINLNDYMTVKPLFVRCRMLKHPNIVTFLGFVMSEMEIVLVMEYIDRKICMN